MAKFNRGDVIVSKETDYSNHITKGKKYTVLAYTGGMVTIVGDKG